jgi:hypothetical protein
MRLEFNIKDTALTDGGPKLTAKVEGRANGFEVEVMGPNGLLVASFCLDYFDGKLQLVIDDEDGDQPRQVVELATV